MNSLVVGGLIKRIYPKFNLYNFSYRLRLQKIVYLLQEQGINLGYTFSWYIYGPYSTALTKDAFNIGNFDEVKPVGFEDEKVKQRFTEFIEKIESKKESDDWLEIASSIHLLKKMYSSETKKQIIERVCNKREALKSKKEEIEHIWDELTEWRWLI